MTPGTQIRVPGLDEYNHTTIELGRVIATLEPPEVDHGESFDCVVRFADGGIDKCDSRQFLNLILEKD